MDSGEKISPRCLALGVIFRQDATVWNKMSESAKQLSRLAIDPSRKVRRKNGVWLFVIFIGVIGLVIAAFAFGGKINFAAGNAHKQNAAPVVAPSAPSAPPKSGDVVLTVSGYVIPRERIEISPKFMGTVKSINVRKGDVVKKGDILVELEDDEYRARLKTAQGNLALAEANLKNAELNLNRQRALATSNIESKRALDEAQAAYEAALANVTVAKGQLALAQLHLDWCTIRAPIDGTVLERMVDPNELVVPQSFGGTGPSTSFFSMADLTDLQVEIDINEADLSKVRLKQKCRVSPEAYPEKKYDGYVAEIAPQANRQKGTLQLKVQILNPDKFLTPELTAKVEFLAE
jgi:HlyD family secretion protein